MRTVYLGRYDPIEADLVVEILTDAGITAMTKIRRTDPNFTQYGSFATDQGVVLVDAERVDEARAVIAEQLPAQLDAIAREMETIDVDAGSPDGDQEDAPGGS